MQDNFKLHFERSGGFAGIILSFELNSIDLSLEENNKLKALIDSAYFFDYSDVDSKANLPDQFQYKISIESEERSHTVNIAENELTENWQPLIQYLNLKARISRK
jgi:hypothetical protein